MAVVKVWCLAFGSAIALAGFFLGGVRLSAWMEERHGETAGIATMLVALAATLATGITMAIVGGGGK